MTRAPTAIALALVSLAFAFAFAACDANVKQGCLAGPCSPDAGDSTTTGSGGGGTGGGNACYADWHLADKCDPAKMPKTGDIPCDVWAVMHKNPIDSGGCHKCHQNPPINGAPFSELRYEDLLRKSADFGYGTMPDERIFQSMLRAISAGLPTGPAVGYTPMPFGTSQPLSCEDALTLSTWLSKCAPPAPEGTGDEACCMKLHDPQDVDAGCP